MSVGLSAAKSKLQADIQKALYDAYKATFILGAGDEGDNIAKKFAMKGAEPIANAVFDFISQAQIVGVINGVVTGASPVGPVTGTNIDSLSGSELSII
jgi:hypothetical protein